MKKYSTTVPITVTVNDVEYTENVPAHMTLLEFLRERLHLTGTKDGCGVGECGACTVILDGKTVASCLVLAAEANDTQIRTIEGEAQDGQLTTLQEAFIKHGGIQCGFCTPGMILSAQHLLENNPNPSREEIVEAIAGNLCRCTGYEPIIEAIAEVARHREENGDK